MWESILFYRIAFGDGDVDVEYHHTGLNAWSHFNWLAGVAQDRAKADVTEISTTYSQHHLVAGETWPRWVVVDGDIYKK